MPAIGEHHPRVVYQRRPADRQIEQQREIEHDVQALPETLLTDLPYRLRAPQQRRKVRPVAMQQAHRQILPRQHRRLARGQPMLDPVAQRTHHRTCVIDDLHPRRDHRRPRIRARQLHHPGQIARMHHVVAPHHHEILRGDQLDAPPEIDVDAQIGVVAQIPDPIVGQRLQPAARGVVGIAVVDDGDPEIAVRLIQDTENRLPQLGEIPVERHHDVDQHPTNSSGSDSVPKGTGVAASGGAPRSVKSGTWSQAVRGIRGPQPATTIPAMRMSG